MLGAGDGAYAAQLFAVSPGGTFERGRSVLQLPADPADPVRYERVRSSLLSARAARVWPARDDKVVAAWNGLAIAALAEAGLLFGRADYIEAASAAADLLTGVHLSDGRLARTSMNGVAGHSAGVLEDYANVAAGLADAGGSDWRGAVGNRRRKATGQHARAVPRCQAAASTTRPTTASG